MLSHLLYSIVALVIICVVGFRSGPCGYTCILSRNIGIALTSLILFLYFAGVAVRIIRWRRGGCSSIRHLFLLPLIVIVDAVMMSNLICLWHDCIQGKDKWEFWWEDRTVEIGTQTIPPSYYAREVLAKMRAGEVSVPGIGAPMLTRFPHYCLGAANLGEPGELWVRIVDPKNGTTLKESSRVDAKWSSNPDEKFTYAVQCIMDCGRRNKYYLVRCEIWAKTESDGVEKMIDSNDVHMSGAY